MWYSIHQGYISANEMSGGVEDGVYVVLVYVSIILNTYIGISKQVINVFFFPFLLYNFESLISTQ